MHHSFVYSLAQCLAGGTFACIPQKSPVFICPGSEFIILVVTYSHSDTK